MAGRKANASGQLGYSMASFPRIPIPSGYQANWTMIHAIARQESQFDRQAVSHAGERGLMQLMPATAQEQDGKIGLSYSPASLSDTKIGRAHECKPDNKENNVWCLYMENK